MAEDSEFENLASIIRAEVEAPYKAFRLLSRPVLDVEKVVTQMLENNLGYLDSLRRSIELVSRKNISDVREFGDTLAASVLAGVEETIGYDGLLDIIAEMKDGIAFRRMAQRDT